MGDSGKGELKVFDGGARGDTLILVYPVAKGVANVDGETIGDPEGNRDGLTEGEVGDMVKA